MSNIRAMTQLMRSLRDLGSYLCQPHKRKVDASGSQSPLRSKVSYKHISARAYRTDQRGKFTIKKTQTKINAAKPNVHKGLAKCKPANPNVNKALAKSKQDRGLI